MLVLNSGKIINSGKNWTEEIEAIAILSNNTTYPTTNAQRFSLHFHKN